MPADTSHASNDGSPQSLASSSNDTPSLLFKQHKRRLTTEPIAYQKSAIVEEAFPKELAALRAKIKASRPIGERIQSLRAVFEEIKTKQNTLRAAVLNQKKDTEIEPEADLVSSEKEMLISETNDYSFSIESLALAIREAEDFDKKSQKIQKVIIRNIINAYYRLADRWEEAKNKLDKELVESINKMRSSIEALELNSADYQKYHSIRKALDNYEGANTPTSMQVAELVNAIKDLQKRKHVLREWLIIAAVIILTTGIVLPAFFVSTLASLALPIILPWTLVAAGFFLAFNYSWHSYNSKLTAGKGFAIIISLTTAALAFMSVVSSFNLPVVLLLTLGTFLANLILYRSNVPNVINNFVNFFKTAYKQISSKPLRISALSVLKGVVKLFMLSAAVITGAALTIGMWGSWLGVATTFGIGFLTSAYIVFPLMLIAFVANTAFVYRGLNRVFDFLANVRKIYINGLVLIEQEVDGKKKQYYEIYDSQNDPEEVVTTKAYTGLQALRIYCFGLKPSDTKWYAIAKAFGRIVIYLLVVALIVVVSQVALINSNLAYFEQIPELHALASDLLTRIMSIPSYLARISFVALDLVASIAIISQFMSNKFRFNKQLLNELKVWITKFIKFQWSLHKYFDRYLQLVKEQTQDSSIIDVWRATFGDNWKKHWDAQVETDWRRANRITTLYCYVKAFAIVFMRFITFPAIVLNTLSNAFIATGGKANGENIFAPASKATLGGTASASLVGCSASRLASEQEEQMSTKVMQRQEIYRKLSLSVEAERVPSPNPTPPSRSASENSIGGDADSLVTLVSPQVFLMGVISPTIGTPLPDQLSVVAEHSFRGPSGVEGATHFLATPGRESLTRKTDGLANGYGTLFEKKAQNKRQEASFDHDEAERRSRADLAELARMMIPVGQQR